MSFRAKRTTGRLLWPSRCGIVPRSQCRSQELYLGSLGSSNVVTREKTWKVLLIAIFLGERAVILSSPVSPRSPCIDRLCCRLTGERRKLKRCLSYSQKIRLLFILKNFCFLKNTSYIL